MKKINTFRLLASICAMSLLVSCDFENINTDWQGMTDEEGIRDGFAVGGSVTSLQKTVFPVGTQADDTDVINQYQIAYNLSADSWSGFFGQNNDWGGNAHATYYLRDGWVSATYTHAYTNALVPWKNLKASAEKNDTPEVFALAQILKISAWHKALESFGPIPYSHAADATMNIPFDSEKDVYTAMFNDLTAAVEVLTQKAEGGMLLMEDFDAVYAGDTRKWVKYANSLMLRLAIRVRYADEAMAKKYALQAVTHPIGVMTVKDEGAQMSTGAGITFRNNINWLSEQYNETRMGSSIFSYLMGYNDPRLGAYFKPVDATCQFGQPAADGKLYQAVPAGHRYGQNDVFKSFSKPKIEDGTPTYWLRASEVYFLRAEAALVWGGEFGSADELYKQGIDMSFQENGVSASVDAYMQSGAMPAKHEVGGSYSCSFVAPSTVTAAFEGSTEEKLEKIITQKWIALYPNGQEAWTEWRRTGYPKLNPVMVNEGSFQGATKEGGVRRMIYPASFKDTEELKAALQYFNNGQGGEDKSSTRLWWDCKR